MFYIKYFVTFLIFSILVSSIAGLGQIDIRRLFGFSSINQMSFIVLSILSFNYLGYTVGFLYLVMYILFTVSFILLMLLVRNNKGLDIFEIRSLTFLKKNDSFLSWLLSINILFLSGLPPSILFFFKFLVLYQSFGNFWFGLVATLTLLSSLISFFFYLRISKSILLTKKKNKAILWINKIEPLKGFILLLFLINFLFFLDPNFLFCLIHSFISII